MNYVYLLYFPGYSELNECNSEICVYYSAIFHFITCKNQKEAALVR